MVFLSTPSARRATQYWVSEQYTNQFLSTPSARRATEELIYKRLSEAISIHALREEGDGKEKHEVTYKRISIHALREEGDFQSLTKALYSYHDFYPRPPRGGRLATHQYCNDAEPFLSTPSARRATSPPSVMLMVGEFLSTPSARRATRRSCICCDQ